jgi:sugar lactone lactonase YvrE
VAARSVSGLNGKLESNSMEFRMNKPCREFVGFWAGVLVAAGITAIGAQAQNAGTVPAEAPGPVFHENWPPESNNYPLGSDSLPHASVPAGKIFTFNLTDSTVFPDTTHVITVYIPAAYHGDKAACVYVGLDHLGFNSATVFDNLIAQHAMPVTIGIGVSSGTVSSADPPNDPRYDRSFEFDSLNDRLGRFLLEDVLPEVAKHRTPDGKPILLSTDPNDRVIAGGSTGGIGAFTVAWEYPNAFRRVFSAIGTFVGMRGGEQYYVLVRKTEPKPLRIFMEDGVHDEWPGGPEMGDWWMSNETMNRALTFAGYDVRHIWGAGTHSGDQADAVFPVAMRWLWRDWPAPIRAGESGNPVLRTILEPGSGWQLTADGCESTTYLAANQQGQVFYESGGDQAHSLSLDAANPVHCEADERGVALAFGPDGRLYRARVEGGVSVSSGTGRKKSVTLAPGLHIRDLTVRANGDIYATAAGSDGQSAIWLIRSTGKDQKLADGLKGASGIALTPDGVWMFVAQAESRYGMSYRVQEDGTIDAGEPFYDFSVPAADNSGAGGVAMDRDGRVYVATRSGVQVFDRNGRVTAILSLPDNKAASSVCFGGRDFDTLYVAAGDKIYRRKLHVAGAPGWAAAIRLPKGEAG